MRLVALFVSLAAVWLMLGLLVEPFIGWYSGVDEPIPARAWIDWSLQLVVDLAALVLAWRVVRAPRTAAERRCRTCATDASPCRRQPPMARGSC